MKPEKEAYLFEMLEIITVQLLQKGDFCGSQAGRRLSELRWKLLGISRSHTFDTDRANEPQVTRTLTLSTQADNALTTAAERAGLSRNHLIETAIEMLLAENRLA